MTQCGYVDTAVNAILDINKMKDDKVSAKTGVAVPLECRATRRKVRKAGARLKPPLRKNLGIREG
jgi:hypothetical protein